MKPFPLHWIPLLPLLGAAYNLTLGHRSSRRAVHLVACLSVLGALGVVMAAVFGELWGPIMAWHPGDISPALAFAGPDWIVVGSLDITFGMRCDALTAVMLIVVTLVGTLIHVYSTGYMDHERDYARFFGYLNLFMGAMLILVLADNLVLMFVGWEGVGLCSYLLIGFWYDKDGTQRWGLANASAGRKAFIVNRIGDFAFVLGMFVLFSEISTLNFEQMAGQVTGLLHQRNVLGMGPFSVASIAALLLFIGATGKSAQIPLYVWLPDAMAGPTPVSALIHAATMVTAGVYMIARLNVLYMLAPWVMGLVALVGALTALFAAAIAFAQNDIKKVLAYSTVSQLGYMFIGVGVGAFSAAVFHLFTHAFFKACLFLCAGAVIHALHDEQDIRAMGGLRGRLKVTHLTFLVSTLAIAGIAPLSGFFSKDEILWKSLTMGNPAFGPAWLPAVLYVLGLAAALCTAFYMFRLYALTFLGPCRLSPEQQHHIHVPGQAMRVPLLVLAFFAAVVGPLALPGLFGDLNLFHHWLEPVVGAGAHVALVQAGQTAVAENVYAHSHGLELALLLLSLVVALASSFAAYRLYHEGPSRWAADFSERFRGLYRASLNKFWVDELYQAVFIKPFKALAWALFKVADRGLIDILCVHGVAWIVDGLGKLARRLQSGNLQQYVVALVIGVSLLIYFASVPPSAFTTTPEGPVAVEQSVVFDATPAVTADRRELRYRWDFDGDGTWDFPQKGADAWSRSAVVRHRYDKPGRYRVVLRVRDPRWQTWKEHVRTVEVRPTQVSLTVEGGR